LIVAVYGKTLSVRKGMSGPAAALDGFREFVGQMFQKVLKDKGIKDWRPGPSTSKQIGKAAL
jgi:hypothetical protein